MSLSSGIRPDAARRSPRRRDTPGAFGVAARTRVRRRPAPCSRALAIGLVVLAGALAAGAGRSPAQTPGDRQERIAELQRQGRVAEALTLSRQEVAAHPGDPRLLYNQACLENRNGEAAAALRSLRGAFACGFADFDFALADPDLQGALADSTRALVAAQRRQRAAMGARSGARLRFGEPATVDVQLWAPRPPEARALRVAALTIAWVQAGLELRLTGDDRDGALLRGPDAAPWSGQGGLVVLLGGLAGDGSGETDDCIVLGFGTEKGAGAGALLATGTGRWQRVRELAPKIRGGGTADCEFKATIPWTALRPYHPLTDPALGLNVALVEPGGRVRAALVPDDVLDRAREPRHLAARLEFDLTTAPAGELRGRTPTTLVAGGALALNLVATSAAPGPARLTLDFQDGQGHSLLASGPQPQDVTLTAGLNAINRAVDFSQLPDGPCWLSASLALPSGTTATWTQWVLNLGPTWEQRYRAAIAGLPAAEQPTALHYLTTVAAAVAAHRDRRDPGPLTTTLGELNQMLAQFRQSGSVLPPEGLAPFVIPGPDGADRLCRLVVPVGRPAGAPLVPVIVAGHTALDAPRLAERMLRFLDDSGGRATAVPGAKSWPVFVVAPGSGQGDDAAGSIGHGDDAALRSELESCVRWAREHYAAGRVLLAAQAWAVAPALELARAPGLIDGLLVFADRTLQPWPGLTPAELDRRVGPPPAGLTVTWVDFTRETALGGQGRPLRDALRRLGWRVDDERINGGTNFTQIADRTCRWQSSRPSAPTGASGPRR